LMLSFLMFLGMITSSFGFFPAPIGPKAPDYPSYSSSSITLPNSTSGSSQTSSSYDNEITQYRLDTKKYREEQKTFTQNKVIPYARNMFVGWVIVLIIIGIIGIILAKALSELVSGAYIFTGVWAAIFGPLGGVLWFANSLISGFAGKAEASFSVEPIFQAVGFTSIVGVIILTFLGILLFPKEKNVTI